MAKKFKVEAVSRTFNKKFGGYGVKVGDNEWINVKSIDGIDRGATISGDMFKKNGRPFLKNVKVLSAGNGGSGGYKGKGGGGNYGNVDWNASVARAIEAAELLLKHDAHALGAKSKPAERKVAVLALVDELTVKFYKELSSKAPLKAEAEVDEDLEDGDDDEESDDDSDGEDESDDDSDSDDDDVFEDD